MDELYEAVIVSPLGKLSYFLFSFVDRVVIDGSVNGLAAIARIAGDGLGRVQTGRVNLYATIMLIGGVLLAGSFLLAVLPLNSGFLF